MPADIPVRPASGNVPAALRHPDRPFKRHGRPLVDPNNRKPEGRPRGRELRSTRIIRFALEMAAHEVGEPVPVFAGRGTARKRVGWRGTGTDGLVGYLKWLAVEHPGCFVPLLARLMPIQINNEIAVRDETTKKFSVVEIDKLSYAQVVAMYEEAVSLTRPMAEERRLAAERQLAGEALGDEVEDAVVVDGDDLSGTGDPGAAGAGADSADDASGGLGAADLGEAALVDGQ